MNMDENDEDGVNGFWVLLLTAGALLGLHLATRKSAYERKLEETASLMVDEGRRLRKSIDPSHVELSLRRFNAEQLELFNRYVKAVIHRDIASWEAMKNEWKAKILPVIANAPEWREYEGIIIGG